MTAPLDKAFPDKPLTAEEAGAIGFMPLAPSRRPLVGHGDFRDAMASMASTVTVVAAGEGAERAGRTATAVFSLAAAPPSILVSIDNGSLLAATIRHRGSFSLAVLSLSQWTIADAFADRIAPEHRFKCGRWESWPSGNPKLEGAVVVMDCDVIGAIETAGHVLFAGGIAATETDKGRKPLLWHNRGYASPTARGV